MFCSLRNMFLIRIRSRGAPAPASITVFNLSFAFTLSRADLYETLHLVRPTVTPRPITLLSQVAAVQGLANRDAPRLYVLWTAADATWLSYLQSNWLNGTAITQAASVADLVSRNHHG